MKEDIALVQFVALHRDMQPTALNSKSKYWEKASKYIHEVAGTSYLQEGNKLKFYLVLISVTWKIVILNFVFRIIELFKLRWPQVLL